VMMDLCRARQSDRGLSHMDSWLPPIFLPPSSQGDWQGGGILRSHWDLLRSWRLIRDPDRVRMIPLNSSG
jgi:hypothetical protein